MSAALQCAHRELLLSNHTHWRCLAGGRNELLAKAKNRDIIKVRRSEATTGDGAKTIRSQSSFNNLRGHTLLQTTLNIWKFSRRPTACPRGGCGNLLWSRMRHRLQDCHELGMRVTVLQKAPELRPIGDSVGFGSNVTRLFKRWGIFDPLWDISSRATEILAHNWDSTVLTTQTQTQARLMESMDHRM